MLKKIKKDETGSALMVAVMVMLVVFILVASFIGNVTASTRIDTDSVQVDQAYLVAKSGMRYMEDTIGDGNYTASQVKALFGGSDDIKFGSSSGGSDLGYCEVEIEDIDPANHQYNIIVTGHSGGASYRLYKYAALPDETTQTTTNTPPANQTRKSAYTGYNYGTGSELNYGVIGPTSFLGSQDISSANANGATVNNIATRGNFTINTSNGKGFMNSIFCDKTVTINHAVPVYGEIWCHKFDATASGNHVAVHGGIYSRTTIDIIGIESGGQPAYYSSLTSGGDTTIKGKTAVNGDVVCGGNLTIGANSSNESINIYGDIYCNGNVVINLAGDNISGSSAKINIYGDVYASGSVIIKKNGTIIYSSLNEAFNYTGGTISGTIYSLVGENIGDTRYEGKNGETILDGKFPDGSAQKIVDDITARLESEIGVSATPYVDTPSNVGDMTWTTLNQISTLCGTPVGEKYGYSIYEINKSGTLGSISTMLGAKDDTGKTPAILIRAAAGETVNIKVTGDLLFNNKGGKIFVDDSDHAGLIRLFLAPGISVGLNNYQPLDGTSVSSDFSNNGWNFVPLDKNGEADWDYVPNLYVFSEDTGNGANYVSDITSQNTAGCFAGYWLTPHLTAKAQVARSFTKSGGGSADEDTPVEKDNCPWIHGMLSVDHIAGSPSSGGAFVKYYDPDWNGNQWDYLSATYDVYKVVS